MMDIEKLIERLRNNNIENNCHDCALGYYAFEAATALSTLQAENEKLRETVDKYATAARAIALHLKPFCDESLPYDEMIADAARKASDELEQVKRDLDAAVKDMEALMWFSGEGCHICAHEIVIHKEPYVRSECALGNGAACCPTWRGRKED